MYLMHGKTFGEEPALRSLSARLFGGELPLDLYEEEGNLIAKLGVAGIDPEALDIYIDDDRLAITGTRVEEREEERKNYYAKEIRRGSFSRAARLPKRVDAEATSASYEDGMVTVTMPLAEAESGRTRVSVERSV